MPPRPAPRSGNISATLRLAADIGGTFTDIAVFDARSGQLTFGKALSTPHHLVEGITAAVAKAGSDYRSAGLFLHGSTIAINTILERTGARTALIITRGFRDIYEIGRINRPDAYNLFFQKHEPLVERALRFEIDERVLADGEIDRPLEVAEVAALGRKLDELGVEAAAILFLNCYARADHEARAKAMLEKNHPKMFVSASHELSQEYREFERCSTVVANAYIGPKVRRYVGEIDRHIRDAGFAGSFLIVQSTGGLYEAEQAQHQCVRMLESGPAAGVIGTQALCHALGIDNAIAFDMGGTTAKAGVIYQGEALTTGTALIGGYDKALPVQIAMMDIFEVGTGGGSIARLEAGGLRVGPQSAGAAPGPACYGLGGSAPTVTDANLLLGRLAPDRFLGGEMRLDVAAAERALKEKVARPLGMDVTAAADGILRIAATAMSYAEKGVTTERGLDAGDFVLVAYGGAGPLHAVEVAREIGMRRIIIPNAPGVFSAFGMLFADLRYDFVRTSLMRLDDASFDHLEKVYGELEQQGRRHALCRPGARRHGRPAAQCFCQTEPPGDQAALRRHAFAALRHVGPRRARRDRQPAHHRDRPDAQAAAGQGGARQARARQGGIRRPAAGLFFRPLRQHADLAPRRARGWQPHQRAGLDRGARLDHAADAGRCARGGCAGQSRDRGGRAMNIGRGRATCSTSPQRGEVAPKARVRGQGPFRAIRPLTPTLSPTGRGSAPSSRLPRAHGEG